MITEGEWVRERRGGVGAREGGGEWVQCMHMQV